MLTREQIDYRVAVVSAPTANFREEMRQRTAKAELLGHNAECLAIIAEHLTRPPVVAQVAEIIPGLEPALAEVTEKNAPRRQRRPANA